MIQQKIKASQSKQKSYHDKRRNDIKFQVGDHVLFRVNLMTGVGRVLKCRKFEGEKNTGGELNGVSFFFFLN